MSADRLCVARIVKQAPDPQVYVSVLNGLQLGVKSTLTSKLLLSCQEFEGQIKQWCKEAGEDVTYKFAQVGVIRLAPLLVCFCCQID